MKDLEVLGHAVREYRRAKNLSIAPAARAAHLSQSTLQRAETGKGWRLLVGDILRLDAAFGAGGALVALHESLEGTVQAPLYSIQRATTEAGHRWSASKVGPVWVLARSIAGEPTPSRINLAWGPWRYAHEWQSGWILLEDYKVADDVSVPINARVDYPADIIFGTGHIPSTSAQFVDLRNQWVRD